MSETTEKDYSKTVQLPETSFPMKAGLAQSEPERLKKWQAMGAYEKLREERKGAPRWVLHDGPPFANGDIHMGTALNKILKDQIVRYQTMKGFDAPFVPGFDTHGMPIEFKVSKALGADRAKKSPLEIRQLCAAEADTFIARQTSQFQRLGVWGDWGHPYVTKDPGFEAKQLEVYYSLLKSGQIYRGLKPVHWCVYDQTALAEAELEYKDHASPAVFVKYPLAEKGTFAVIWTTTPWTLPASLAITVNPLFDYAFYEVDGERWLLAQSLAGSLFEKLGKKPAMKQEFKGTELETFKARHPFLDREVRFCVAPYVTSDSGTGLVHTAPGHGAEDYVTGARYGLPVFCPVGADGRYTDEFEPMLGKRVTDPEVNAGIIELLKEKGALVLQEKLQHSYPHCWRCKNPIIFRATKQWFMSLENNGLREKVLGETAKVQWITQGGKERFSNMMKDRADWCISRQRFWGVPIYMFLCKSCGEPHFDDACLAKVKPLVEKRGGDAWYDPALGLKDFLPEGARCAKCGGTDFERERDTLDVWFDSGSTSAAVLKARADQSFPAELYVEAGDQYRGWFQSSMLVSAGVNGAAPYKSVLSHGWMLDAKGQAMHKSAGNAIDPMDVMQRYGADILRLWMASEDVTKDLHFGEEILKGVAENYRRLRNSFRWLLGNLRGFEPSKAVEISKLETLDRWLLSQLAGLVEDCSKALDAYEFQRFYARLVGFCSGELSSFVFDIHKDTLYTLAPNDSRRLSAQTALYHCLQVITRLSAPVLAYTSEEVWEHMPASWKDAESVHFSKWPVAGKDWKQADVEADFELIVNVLMPVVKKKLEEARTAKTIGHPYDAKVILKLHSKKLLQALSRHEAALAAYFIVSELVLERAAPQDGLQVGPDEVAVLASSHTKCARCWRRPGDVKAEGGICGRCSEALA
jgi:isoleucyl-tRNA synthetase